MAEKDGEQAQEGNDERIIGEEYKNWKKNTPFLYDLVSQILFEMLSWFQFSSDVFKYHRS